MIAHIRYQLPHVAGSLTTHWVTPTHGWDLAMARASFQRNNPQARILEAVDVTPEVQGRRRITNPAITYDL